MKPTLCGLVATAALVIAAPYSRSVQATQPAGFTGQTIVKGTFGDIDVFNHIAPPDFWKYDYRHIPRPLWPWDEEGFTVTFPASRERKRPEED